MYDCSPESHPCFHALRLSLGAPLILPPCRGGAVLRRRAAIGQAGSARVSATTRCIQPLAHGLEPLLGLALGGPTLGHGGQSTGRGKL